MNRRDTLSLVLLLAGMLVLTGCKGGTKKVVFSNVGSALTPGGSGKKTGNETSVTAVQLCDDYKSGESTADGNYKGKEIQVKGTVRSVRKDFVELKGTGDAKSGSRAVRCYFTDVDAMSKLKKDEEVKVTGTCQGKQGSGDNFDVVLKNCKLAK